MYAIFRHRYDHRVKHKCRNKVKAIKERTHWILYWFGVTLHPFSHTSMDFVSKAIFTITPSISRQRGTLFRITILWVEILDFSGNKFTQLISQGYNHTLSRLIDFQGYNHTFSRYVDNTKPITLNSTEDPVEIVIENQTRDNLVRFNVDFGRVMIRICI